MMITNKFIQIAVTVFLSCSLALHIYRVLQEEFISGIIGIVFSVVALFYQFVTIVLTEIQRISYEEWRKNKIS